MRRGSETVRQRPEPQDDGMGNTTPVSPEDYVVHDGCSVTPRGRSTEDGDRAATVIDGLMVLIPKRAVVGPRDEFEWAERPNVWYKVVGEPGLWKTPSGRVMSTQVNLERAVG